MIDVIELCIYCIVRLASLYPLFNTYVLGYVRTESIYPPLSAIYSKSARI